MSQATTRTTSVTALAKSLSLSVGTVSQAINGHPAVAERTRTRVLEAARKAGYVPNRQAVALRTQKTRVIGLLIPTLRNPIYIERVASIQAFAHSKGYETSFATSEWQPEQEAALARHFLGMAVDALIIDGHIAMPMEKYRHAFEPLINRGTPILQIAHGTRGVLPGVTRINMDVSSGIYESISHLLSLGHVHIGTVGINSDPQAVHNAQRQGIDRALAKHGKDVRMEYFGGDAASEKAAYEAVIKRLDQPGPFPTAIQTVSDQVALGVLKALHDRGRRVPEDVSVIGFDNLAASEFYQPSLTTVSQTHLNMGHLAVDTILGQLDNHSQRSGQSNVASQTIDLKLKLVVRQSAGPCPSTSPSTTQSSNPSAKTP